jgi:hypothetical protein
VELPEDKRASEYLANERTFLAWIRTSIAIISLGFVIAKFGVWLRELATEIGMVGLGVMGRNLVLNMADHGFPVAGYDKDQSQGRGPAPGIPAAQCIAARQTSKSSSLCSAARARS